MMIFFVSVSQQTNTTHHNDKVSNIVLETRNDSSPNTFQPVCCKISPYTLIPLEFGGKKQINKQTHTKPLFVVMISYVYSFHERKNKQWFVFVGLFLPSRIFESFQSRQTTFDSILYFIFNFNFFGCGRTFIIPLFYMFFLLQNFDTSLFLTVPMQYTSNHGSYGLSIEW
jgi:hypothetical protein